MPSGYEHEPDFGGPKSVWASLIIPLVVMVVAVALAFWGVL
jgi:flagellar basal body-associated protein FliL